MVAVPPPSNAWNVRPSPEVQECSLADVMSEQLAKSLQNEEEHKVEQQTKSCEFVASELELASDDDDPCGNDLLLAQMMQTEFDREHDTLLRLEEDKVNGKSKVSVSYANYRKMPDSYYNEGESSDSDLDDSRDWDSFEEREKKSPVVGKSGFTKHGSTITTKHDAAICGRKNACRVMGFPPGFETGDAGGFDMQLSNSVYNHLKVHSKMEEKRHRRLHDKTEKSTAEQALDPKTRLLLYKLVNGETLESVNGCISTGKEAVILHAVGGKVEGQLVPPECALKVYKTTLNEFKNRDIYIRDDYRFKDRFSKQNPRKVIRMWAEKEMHNLNRMRKAGILCPEVVTLKKHILVMSFIGHDGKPAPKLKDVRLSPEHLSYAYQQTVEDMKTLYTKCSLIHADLSEYNLLWHQNRVWMIDVSQSVEPAHPQGLEFLYRDCCNISNFFSKEGLSDVASPKELFCTVSGLDLPGEGAEFLSQIRTYETNEELLTHGINDKSDCFDYLFDLSKKSTQPSSIKGKDQP